MPSSPFAHEFMKLPAMKLQALMCICLCMHMWPKLSTHQTMHRIEEGEIQAAHSAGP